MSITTKLKLNRNLLYLLFPVAILLTVVWLFIAKGTDLGQKKDDQKVTEKAKEDKAKLQPDRVEDPENKTATDYKAAQEAALAKRPPLPPEPAISPGVIDAKSGDMRRAQLEAARNAVDKTLPNDSKANMNMGEALDEHKKSFLVYSAAGDDDGIITSTVTDAKKGANILADEFGGTDSGSTSKDKKKSASKANSSDSANAGDDDTDVKVKPAPQAFLTNHNDMVKPELVVTATRINGTHWIAGGTIIRAALLGAIDTSVCGQVTARTTEPVYDSRYGRNEVIPVGSTLLGQCDSKVADGQERIVIAFSSLITPAGGVVNLNAMKASDALGRMGVQGDLHTRFWERMGVATMLAFESVALNRLNNSQTTVTTSGSTSSTSNASDGAKIISDAANKEMSMRTSEGAFITLDEGQVISVITKGNIEIPPVANQR